MTAQTADKPVPFSHCAVLGAGSWGTALAMSLARAGRKVTLWARTEAVADAITQAGENQRYLPGISLPSSIRATADPAALAGIDAALCVIPAQHVRAQLPVIRDALGGMAIPLALCCKGIEQTSGLLMHEVGSAVWPTAQISVLSGPSFAADVARGLPAAVTLAATDQALAARWAATLATPTFRPYVSDDVLGAELGGAMKNVLAIACGVVEGRGLGESAKAALMARGFAECLRFAVAMGGRAETMHGLSGLGDLILTCSSRQSRNMSLGYEMGKGRSASAIMGERHSVAEGAATAPILVALGQKHGVEMPVARAVVDLIQQDRPVDEVVNQLLNRPLRAEIG